MDVHLALQIIILIILLILSAAFSSAETAITTVNIIKLRTLSEDKNKNSDLIIDMLTSKKNKLLSSILVGNNIVNLFASALVTSIVIDLIGKKYVGIFTGALTFIILIFGEICPKTIASIKAEKILFKYIKLIKFWMIFSTPIIFIINIISNFILKLFRINNNKSNTITQEELHTVFDVSHEEGVIKEKAHEMLHNIIDFGETLTKDVMVPKIHIDYIDVNSSFDEVVSFYQNTKHTRYPVFKDDTDNIIGILNMKDILLLNTSLEFDLSKIIREVNFTYENKLTAELLKEMRRNSINIEIVLDEFGNVSGLITLEDLLEEIVGEIKDEYDEEEEKPIIKISENDYEIEGSTSLEYCNKNLGIFLDSEDYDSIGGYIIEKLDKIPEIGDKYTSSDNITFVVKKIEKNRIETVSVHLPYQADTNHE